MSGSAFLWAYVPLSEVGSLWEVVLCLSVSGTCFHKCSVVHGPYRAWSQERWVDLDLCLTSALPFLFLQQEGDAITLKPRPSADMTNSSAPSPSHKVQRSVSANPKQRRFSDQGKCFWEL